MDEWFRTLATRRPYARRLVWRKVRPGDVIHAPSWPLEVLSEPVQPEGSQFLEVVVVDRFGNGDTFERPLRHPALRDVLVSRAGEVPADLRV
jgi:hypothetical protein